MAQIGLGNVDDEYIKSLLAEIEARFPSQKRSLWQKVTQPVKTLFGATGGIGGKLAGVLAPDLYEEALQKNLESISTSRGTNAAGLSDAEKIEALPGLGQVITQADIFQDNTVGRTVAPVLGLVGDIAGDPTTYLGGAGALSKIAAVKKLAAGTAAAETLEVLAKAGVREGSFTGRALESAGAALAGGNRGRAAFETAKAVVPSLPFGAAAGLVYAPEMFEGIRQPLGQIPQDIREGKPGQAVERLAQSALTATMTGLVARGIYRDADAARLIREFHAPVKSPQEAAAVVAQEHPEMVSPPVAPEAPAAPLGTPQDISGAFPRQAPTGFTRQAPTVLPQPVRGEGFPTGEVRSQPGGAELATQQPSVISTEGGVPVDAKLGGDVVSEPQALAAAPSPISTPAQDALPAAPAPTGAVLQPPTMVEAPTRPDLDSLPPEALQPLNLQGMDAGDFSAYQQAKGTGKETSQDTYRGRNKAGEAVGLKLSDKAARRISGAVKTAKEALKNGTGEGLPPLARAIYDDLSEAPAETQVAPGPQRAEQRGAETQPVEAGLGVLPSGEQGLRNQLYALGKTPLEAVPQVVADLAADSPRVKALAKAAFISDRGKNPTQLAEAVVALARRIEANTTDGSETGSMRVTQPRSASIADTPAGLELQKLLAGGEAEPVREAPPAPAVETRPQEAPQAAQEAAGADIRGKVGSQVLGAQTPSERARTLPQAEESQAAATATSAEKQSIWAMETKSRGTSLAPEVLAKATESQKKAISALHGESVGAAGEISRTAPGSAPLDALLARARRSISDKRVGEESLPVIQSELEKRLLAMSEKKDVIQDWIVQHPGDSPAQAVRGLLSGKVFSDVVKGRVRGKVAKRVGAFPTIGEAIEGATPEARARFLRDNRIDENVLANSADGITGAYDLLDRVVRKVQIDGKPAEQWMVDGAIELGPPPSGTVRNVSETRSYDSRLKDLLDAAGVKVDLPKAKAALKRMADGIAKELELERGQRVRRSMTSSPQDVAEQKAIVAGAEEVLGDLTNPDRSTFEALADLAQVSSRTATIPSVAERNRVRKQLDLTTDFEQLGDSTGAKWSTDASDADKARAIAKALDPQGAQLLDDILKSREAGDRLAHRALTAKTTDLPYSGGRWEGLITRPGHTDQFRYTSGKANLYGRTIRHATDEPWKLAVMTGQEGSEVQHPSAKSIPALEALAAEAGRHGQDELYVTWDWFGTNRERYKTLLEADPESPVRLTELPSRDPEYLRLGIEPQESPPRPSGPAPGILGRLEGAAEAARARLDQRGAEVQAAIEKGGSQAGVAVNIAADITDYAIIAAHKIATQGVKFAEWVKELPEHLRVHAKEIWARAQSQVRTVEGGRELAATGTDGARTVTQSAAVVTKQLFNTMQSLRGEGVPTFAGFVDSGRPGHLGQTRVNASVRESHLNMAEALRTATDEVDAMRLTGERRNREIARRSATELVDAAIHEASHGPEGGHNPRQEARERDMREALGANRQRFVTDLARTIEADFGRLVEGPASEAVKEAVARQAAQAAPLPPRKQIKPIPLDVEQAVKNMREGKPVPEEGAKPGAAPPQEESFYNTHRNIIKGAAKDDAVKLGRELYPHLDRSKRESWKKVAQEAFAGLGRDDPEEFIARIQKAGAQSTVDTVKLRAIANTHYQAMNKAKEAAETALASGDKARYADAQQKYIEQVYKTASVAAAAANDATSVARQLRVRGMMLGAADPAGLQLGRLRSGLERMLKEEGNKPADAREIALTLTGEFEKGNYAGILKAIREVDKKTVGDMLAEAFKANLIGAPSVAAAGLSNTLFEALRYPERALGAGLDKLLTMAGVQAERQFVQPSLPLMAHAKGNAVREGWHQLSRDLYALAKGEGLELRPEDFLSAAETDFKNIQGAIPGRLGNYIRTSLTAMNVVDRLAKTQAKHTESMYQAVTRAWKDGARGEALNKQALGHYQELVGAATDMHHEGHGKALAKWKDAVKAIYDEMDTDTFQAPLEGIFGSISKLLGKHKWTVAGIPFKTTPMNVFLETIRRTPLGFFTAASRAKANGGVLGKELAKPLIGTAVMGMLYSLADEGGITGSGPLDPEQKAALQETGWLPYSFKLGDQYIAYQRLEPISSLLGIAADAAEGFRRGDFSSVGTSLERGSAIIAENLTNKTFLQGIEGFFSAYSDPSRYGERFLKGLVGSAVPNSIALIPFGTAARAIDPTYRQTTLMNAAQAKVPFLSEELPAQTTSTGQVRQRPGSILERLLSPFARSEAKKTASAGVAAEMDRIGFPIRPPRRFENIGGLRVEYTREEYEKLRAAQMAATERMAMVLKDPTYLRLPDNELDPRYRLNATTKEDVLRRVYGRFLRPVKASIAPRLDKQAKALIRQRREQVPAYGAGV